MTALYHEAYRIQTASQLSAEVEEGNHEYKLKLTNLTDAQINHRISQLQWRLNEGNNEAFYHIGVEDNGNSLGISESEMNESLEVLKFMAEKTECEMTVRQIFTAEQGLTAEVMMKRKERATINRQQIRIALLGEQHVGKSSLIGVLSSGRLDNGKGLARSRVFTHNHEVASGHTSCISHTLLHFDEDGNVLNTEPKSATFASKMNRLRTLSDLELLDQSVRIVSLIDLAGHSKYYKTTMHGIVGRKPDYLLICISLQTGVAPLTIEYISIANLLHIPIFFVVTKIDQSTGVSNKIQMIVQSLRDVFMPQHDVTFQIVETEDNVTQFIEFLKDSFPPTSSTDFKNSTVPIFCVSSVKGTGLELLKAFFFQLPATKTSWTDALIFKDDVSTANTSSGDIGGNFIRVIGSIGRGDSVEENDDYDFDDAGDFDYDKAGSEICEHAIDENEAHPNAFMNDCQTENNCCTARIQNCDIYEEFSSFVEPLNITDPKACKSKILIGTVLSGHLKAYDTLAFGPARNGEYLQVKVISIRINNIPVKYVSEGQTATFQLQQTSPSLDDSFKQISQPSVCKRRNNAAGLVLYSSLAEPVQQSNAHKFAFWEFEAELLICNHPSKVRINYEPVIHIDSIRQSAKLISITKCDNVNNERPDEISNGEKAICR